MKILLRLILMGILFFGFVGCSKSSSGGDNTPPPPPDNSSANLITGFVIDDAIEGATIEIQELNGTTIKVFNNISKIFQKKMVLLV